ncbi:unannotated protein [freshwater metagenome]|uniref:Unannotated protein n=1 Tax=freshwater metagenome TaxID=449393 RepID=A0A6J6HQA2_9ZZZZ
MVRNCTSGQRSFAFCSTSFSASESLPVIKPILFGRNGNGCLRSMEVRPSTVSCARRRSMRSSSSPRPTLRISITCMVSLPPFGQKAGLIKARTRSPCFRSFGILATFQEWIETLFSICRSRNSPNIFEAPILIEASSPSIHSTPRRSIHSLRVSDSRETGQGESSELTLEAPASSSSLIRPPAVSHHNPSMTRLSLRGD